MYIVLSHHWVWVLRRQNNENGKSQTQRFGLCWCPYGHTVSKNIDNVGKPSLYIKARKSIGDEFG